MKLTKRYTIHSSTRWKVCVDVLRQVGMALTAEMLTISDSSNDSAIEGCFNALELARGGLRRVSLQGTSHHACMCVCVCARACAFVRVHACVCVCV